MNELLIVAMLLFGGQKQHDRIGDPPQHMSPGLISNINCEAQGAARLLCATLQSGGVAVVPAVKITVPASHPCNLPSGGYTTAEGISISYAVCVTGPETHTTCEDKRRVLLTSEDGQSFCLRLDLIGENR